MALPLTLMLTLKPGLSLLYIKGLIRCAIASFYYELFLIDQGSAECAKKFGMVLSFN